MTAAERLSDLGYEDIVIFENPSYDDALIGVSEDGRAVYDYGLMVDWLYQKEGMRMDEAVEFVEYNTIRALPYHDNAPIVMYSV